MRPVPRVSVLLAVFSIGSLSAAPLAHAQITNVTNQTSTPIPGVGHDYIKMLSETVNPSNGSVSLRVQVPSPPGRRMSLPFAFAYDSNGAAHVTSDGNGGLFWASNSAYLATGGWAYSVPMLSNLQFREKTPGYGGPGSRCTYYTDYVFQDATGGRHSFYLALILSAPPTCDYAVPVVPVQQLSGGDDYYNAVLTTSPNLALYVADMDGTEYTFPPALQAHISYNGSSNGAFRSSLPSSIEDRNGNLLTISDLGAQGGAAGAFTVQDTLGRTLISSSGFAVTGNTVTIAGLSSPYTLTWGTPSAAGIHIGSSLLQNSPFGCSAFPQTSASGGSKITNLQLPNGKSYVFSYDPTSGLLSKITYPTGGYVSYTWGTNPLSEFAASEDLNQNPEACLYHYDSVAVTHRYVSFDGVHIALQQDFSYSTTWSSDPSTWTTKTTTVTTTDLISGAVSTTAYTYTPFTTQPQPNDQSRFAPQLPLEQSIVYKNSTGSTLRTANKTWSDQYFIKSSQTVLENGLTSQTNYLYGCGGQIREQDDYDFGNGAPGPLLRKTVTNCQAFSPTPLYPSGPSILDLPCQTIVYDSSGTNRVAETDYLYDGGTAICGTAGTPSVSSVSNLPAGTHDETNYGPSSTAPRGNLTKTIKQCFQGTQSCASGNPTSTFTFDETGQVLSTTDPNNNTTQFSYANNYDSPPASDTNAYLTRITDPLGHTQAFKYAYSDGQLISSTDQNSQVTNYQYNDSLRRLTETDFPDGGKTTISYNDSPSSPTITTNKQINSSQTLTSVVVMDGMSHAVQTQLTSDPQGTVFTNTAYEGVGLVYSVSNPYRSGSDITTTTGTTYYSYDALGRKLTETYPDGSVTTTSYSGNTTTVTDPTGKKRQSTTDGLGHLTQVVEDPGGLGYITNYVFDALGNLTSVVQNSSHQRSFTYDSLSRLVTAANPESGTTTYKYDSDTACASPNSFLGLLVSKTDARGIRTCTQYDALNRPTQTNYSNGDPTVTYVYDQSNCLGLATCQNIGHRTSMTDAAGSEIWAYDVPDRIHRDQRTTNSITKTTTYNLDYAGNVISLTYPTGRVVNYTYDSADRPSTATDGSNGITYATGLQTSPGGTCIANVTCYTPQGTFYALSIGQTSMFTGLNLTHIYNSRLQPQEFKASSTGGNAIDVSYNFVDPVSGKNDGAVYGISNNLDTTRSQTFSYDQLNRITAAQTNSTYSTSPSHCWGETYSVDAWGNMTQIAATTNSAYNGCSQESGFTTSADGNNHLGSLGYDASGNTTGDGMYSYLWNAESQLKSAGGVNYLYDGDGRREAKVGSKLYWHGSGDEILAETDASGNTTSEYVFFGGKRIAMLSSGGNPLYYVEDMLGTSRVMTTNAGVVCYDADFYPYGGERAYTNSCSQNYKFEGKERDTETGNDDFGARYYSNRFGRWLSADWSAVPVPVPYANLTNPQTLNLYAMVSEDPESFADLDGHQQADKAPETPEEALALQKQKEADQAKPTEQQAQQQANADRRGAIAATAQADEGDTSMPYTPGHATCNLFVQRV
jgi:RHS repeat-associated protein